MRRLRYVFADVFTDTPLAGGNQLAVFTDARDLDAFTMQQLAAEIGFAETVFVMAPSSKDADVKIRIFTPEVELPFAGHPTLGTAFVLGGPMQKIRINIETEGGIVPVDLTREGPKITFGWMQQPIPGWQAFDSAIRLVRSFGQFEDPTCPVDLYHLGPKHIFVEFSSPQAVAALKPDMGFLANLTPACINCFAREGDGWKTRMFAPGAGVPEDAATGSAAGPLALHLARHGRINWGDTIRISQGTEIGRPSTLWAQADGTETNIERILVGGSAVIVARGEYLIP